MNLQNVLADLRIDEGFKSYAYEDSRGYLTIGYGTLIDHRGGGISQMEADFLLQNRVQKTIGSLDAAFPWWKTLTDDRQNALVNMAYQLGVAGLSEFKNMLGALQRGDWATAADECLGSQYARQTPERALRISKIFRGTLTTKD